MTAKEKQVEMFPTHQPYFNYPPKKILFGYCQEIRVTERGATHFNAEWEGDYFSMGDLIGHFVKSEKGYEVYGPKFDAMGVVPTKTAAVEGLLKLFGNQQKYAINKLENS